MRQRWRRKAGLIFRPEAETDPKSSIDPTLCPDASGLLLSAVVGGSRVPQIHLQRGSGAHGQDVRVLADRHPDVPVREVLERIGQPHGHLPSWQAVHGAVPS